MTLPIGFKIEDEAHAEGIGEFASREEALAELRRLASLTWDEPPNQAPCTNWRNCGRRYELVRCEIEGEFWRELERTPVLEVSSAGTTWTAGFGSRE